MLQGHKAGMKQGIGFRVGHKQGIVFGQFIDIVRKMADFGYNWERVMGRWPPTPTRFFVVLTTDLYYNMDMTPRTL